MTDSTQLTQLSEPEAENKPVSILYKAAGILKTLLKAIEHDRDLDANFSTITHGYPELLVAAEELIRMAAQEIDSDAECFVDVEVSS